MTFNECKFCFYLFCTYYDGKNVQDIPNMEGMPAYIKIDSSKIYIKKGGIVTEFNSPKSIFWVPTNCDNKFRLNHSYHYKSEIKFYSSVKDFLNHFKIPFKDIV